MTDPYKSGLAGEVRFVKKRAVEAVVTVVLKGTISNRGLKLIDPRSRCVREKEIFEFMIAEDPNAAPGGVVNTVRYLGFAEVQEGGSLCVGDKVMCDGELLGWVVGFDETHIPNHQNIVLRGSEKTATIEQRMNLDSLLEFIMEEK